MRHVDDEVLLRLHYDTLEPAEVDVRDHVRTCPECSARLAELNRRLDLLSQYGGEDELDDRVVEEAMRRVRQLHADREAERVSSSRPPRPPGSPRPERDAMTGVSLWEWLGTAAEGSLRPIRIGALAALGLAAAYVGGGSAYMALRSPSYDLQVDAESVVTPGSHWFVSARVRQEKSSEPASDVPVRVRLRRDTREWDLYSGKTGPFGDAAAGFDVPDLEDGSYELVVTSRPRLFETDEVVHPVKLKREYRVHLSTDKPMYQPGQLIHIRALALEEPRSKPASGVLSLAVFDPKGNRLALVSPGLSKFGVASFDFELASEVALGAYKVTGSLGDTKEELEVQVSRYTLPKFKVEVVPDQASYLAGETVKARVRARYFFGKVLSDASVRGVAVRTDGSVVGAEIDGKTNAQGEYAFSVELPPGLAEEKPESVALQVTVKDSAGQEERGRGSVAVSRETLVVDLFANDGRLAAALPNKVYVVTSTPDGRVEAAKVTLTLRTGREVTLRTESNGVGVFSLGPEDFGDRAYDRRFRQPSYDVRVSAVDDQGRRASRQVSLPQTAFVMVGDTDQVVYRTGESVVVHLNKDDSLPGHLDVFMAGQRIQSFDISNPGPATLTLPPALRGEVILDTEAGGLTARHRILVLGDDQLHIGVKADQPEYRPGAKARFHFEVSDSKGKPTAAAIGVTMVDESLFALAEARPEMARAYFLLSRSLLEPVAHTSAGEVVSLATASAPQQLAAGLLFSLAKESPSAPRSQQTTYAAAEASIRDASREFDNRATWIFFGAAVLFSLLLVVVGGWYLPNWVLGGLLLSVACGEGFLALWFTQSQQSFSEGFALLGLTTLAAGFPLGMVVHHIRRGSGEWGVLGGASVVALPACCAVMTFFSGNFRSLFAASANELSGNEQVSSTTAWSNAGKKKMSSFGSGGDGIGEGMAGRKKMASFGARNENAAPAALPASEPANGPKGGAEEAVPHRSVRVREYFPETLFVSPEIIADDQGLAEIEIPLADSITDWRMSLVASSGAGQLGAANAPIRVFQDFFVDLDVPAALIRGDQATIPVAVYNYLKEPQTIRLQIQREPWFEVAGPTTLSVEVPAGGVVGQEIRIRATREGTHKLSVHADGTRLSDAVAREILITDAGQEKDATVSGTLQPGKTTRVAITVPPGAIPGATRLFLKVYPSRLASTLDGLEGTLRAPTGCFEQTSSTTYPNVLVLDYLKRSKKLSPAVEQQAKRFIGLGYQRLLSYEVPGGGFEWFGRAPANLILTAYGLMEFSDMAAVYPVDEAVIRRTQTFLTSHQTLDGHWNPDPQYLNDGLWKSSFEGNVAVTAYVTWALAESGYQGAPLDRALSYLDQQWRNTTDSYSLSLITAAMARAHHPSASLVATELSRLALTDGTDSHFQPATATVYYGNNLAGAAEATALGGYALAKSSGYAEVVKGALGYLTNHRDYQGTWHSTQGTILALRALLLATSTEDDQTVSVRLNSQSIDSIHLQASADAPAVVELSDKARGGDNVVEIEGQKEAAFQVVATFKLPWRDAARDETRPLTLRVEFGRTQLKVGGIVPVDLSVGYRRDAPSGMVLVSLGIPAGLSPLPEDLEALREHGKIGRYEVEPGKVNLYMDRLENGKAAHLSLRLKARNKVQTAGVSSLAYLYYSPDVRALEQPTPLTVD